MSFDWLRLWVDIIDDEKLRLLAFEDRWHYVAILCLKRKGLLDEKGDPELRNRKIGVKLGLADLERETLMKRLLAVGLIDDKWQPRGWRKRQFSSDSSTYRVREFRKRQRNVSSVLQKPPQTQTQTQISDSEKISEVEARAPRSAPATRLPSDFELTPERRAIAEAEKADPDREFANFVDHWRSASGARARKHDWDATWRIWCRRAPDFKPKPRFSTGHPEDTGWRPTE